MSIAWFISPYNVEKDVKYPGHWKRTPKILELQNQIFGDSGAWAGSEALGNVVVAKIRASDQTLNNIAALTGVIRLPKNLLSQSLSDLTATQKNAIVNKLRNMGYPLQEIRDYLGNDIASNTLGDVLRFAVRRRLTPRLDTTSGELVVDGDERPTKSIDATDDEVSNT